MKKRIIGISLSFFVLLLCLIASRLIIRKKAESEKQPEGILSTTESVYDEYEHLQNIAYEDYELIDSGGNMYDFNEHIIFGGVGYEFVEVRFISSVDSITKEIPDYESYRQLVSDEILIEREKKLWYCEFYLINDSTVSVQTSLGRVSVVITKDGKYMDRGGEPFFISGNDELINTNQCRLVTLEPGERRLIGLGLCTDQETYNLGWYTEDDTLDYYIRIAGVMTDGTLYESIDEDTSHAYLKFDSGRMNEVEQ